jgi:hypothetical protein
MKRRCLDPKNAGWKNYGGRGIGVCKRWQRSFDEFLKDMGPRPSPKHSLDRINNNGSYRPANCRWATSIEQARNKYNTRLLTYAGRSLTIKEWAAEIGIKPLTLMQRVQNGWSVERALTTTTDRKKKLGPRERIGYKPPACYYRDEKRVMRERRRKERELRAFQESPEGLQQEADHARWFHARYPDMRPNKRTRELWEKYPQKEENPHNLK